MKKPVFTDSSKVKPPEFIVAPEKLEGRGPVIIKGRERLHMVQAKRLGPGSLVRLVDGLGKLLNARIKKITPDMVLLERHGTVYSIDDLVPVRLILSVIKGERMDMAVAKLSEMGIKEIQPVITQRTVMRMNVNRLRKKHERWQALSLHSLKQCRGVRATKIMETTTLDSVLPCCQGFSTRIFLYEEDADNGQALSSLINGDRNAFPLAIVVGPEGGFSPEERALFTRHGFKPASLGPRILRSETAAIYGASVACEAFRNQERP